MHSQFYIKETEEHLVSFYYVFVLLMFILNLCLCADHFCSLNKNTSFFLLTINDKALSLFQVSKLIGPSFSHASQHFFPDVRCL
jgi:hypothetical protein